MGRALVIARRELLASVLSPSGYVIIAVFILFTAMYYVGVGAGGSGGSGFSQGAPATLRDFFQIGIWIFLFIAPAISMRSMSEEYRQGTFETLMTAPVTESQIILGKFFGALAFLMLMLVPTLLYVVMMEVYGRPDYGEVACGYAGIILAGGAYLASGVLISSLTSSQVVAYLVTLFFWLILLLATLTLPNAVGDMEQGIPFLPSLEGLVAIASAVNPMSRLRGFTNGLVDTFNVVYFLTFIIVALLIAIKTLESRRWR